MPPKRENKDQWKIKLQDNQDKTEKMVKSQEEMKRVKTIKRENKLLNQNLSSMSKISLHYDHKTKYLNLTEYYKYIIINYQ
jgi:hypothetical protein